MLNNQGKTQSGGNGLGHYLSHLWNNARPEHLDKGFLHEFSKQPWKYNKELTEQVKREVEEWEKKKRQNVADEPEYVFFIDSFTM